MSTPATHYTKLYPKRGDLTGSPNQAYNLLPAKYFDHILGGIGAGMIAALRTVAPGSYNLSYIYAPQVHTDLSGNFIGFIGNVSNKIREFSCVHIHKDAFGLFQIIDSNVNIDDIMLGHSSTVTPLDLNLLTVTNWKDSSDPIIGALFPNFFIVYFGQDFPKGDISLDDIKVNFTKLGVGYSLWITAAAEANEKKQDIRGVLDTAAEEAGYSKADFIKSNFFPLYGSSKMLPIVTRPYGFISIVDSDLFPVETDELGKLFIPAQVASPPVAALSNLSTLTLQLPTDVKKETEAKKGLTKLLLFHICGKISDNSTSFGNLSYPEPSQGMKILLDLACPAHATGFSNLIRNTCTTEKELDLMNIKSRLISIVFINKATALHLLQGNLATDGVTSLNNEANSIDLSLFLPQCNPSLINRERSNDLTACSVNNMDIADAHKSKTNILITRIGIIVDMTDFSSLCINCDTIISAIVDSSGPQPLYQQILLKFVNLMNNPDFGTWYAANKASMPSLHWHVYSFLESIFNHLAKFAPDFGKVNVMSGSRPLTEVNTNPRTKTLTVLKAFEDQLTLVQSKNSPITSLTATLSKFSTRTLATNLIVITQASAPISTFALPKNTQIQCRNVKRNPSTPDKGAKTAAVQHQKKPCRNVATNHTKQRPVTDMDMFFLARNDIKTIDIFPKDLLTKICANFTCKGRECTRESCPYSHPRNACKLPATPLPQLLVTFQPKKLAGSTSVT
jgi:hypothetical protein